MASRPVNFKGPHYFAEWAKEAFPCYLDTTGNKNLALGEVMQFQ